MLKSIDPVKLENTVLGQYVGNPEMTGEGASSYLDDPTVPKGSITPTFASIMMFIRNERWDGIYCHKVATSRSEPISQSECALCYFYVTTSLMTTLYIL